MNNKLKEIFGPNFNISDIEFNPQPTSSSILYIESLENDKVFKALKQELNLYFIEKKRAVDRQTLHKGRSLEWKERFYQSLQTLMNEIIFTNTTQMRKALLNKILKWYVTKTGTSPIPEARNFYCRSPGQECQVYIPQNIESTVEEKKPALAPYMPAKIDVNLSAQDSQVSLFGILLRSENDKNTDVVLPKVRNLKREPLIRPYSQLKGSNFNQTPVVMDFRSTSRAKSTSMSRNPSPDTFRHTSYNSAYDKGYSVDYSAVPFLRRLQIKEVMKIKKRMASKKLVCPVKVLEGGLVISDYGQRDVSPEHFPKGGELLIHDPFENQGKGKKKKRKVKKK